MRAIRADGTAGVYRADERFRVELQTSRQNRDRQGADPSHTASVGEIPGLWLPQRHRTSSPGTAPDLLAQPGLRTLRPARPQTSSFGRPSDLFVQQGLAPLHPTRPPASPPGRARDGSRGWFYTPGKPTPLPHPPPLQGRASRTPRPRPLAPHNRVPSLGGWHASVLRGMFRVLLRIQGCGSRGLSFVRAPRHASAKPEACHPSRSACYCVNWMEGRPPAEASIQAAFESLGFLEPD